MGTPVVPVVLLPAVGVASLLLRCAALLGDVGTPAFLHRRPMSRFGFRRNLAPRVGCLLGENPVHAGQTTTLHVVLLLGGVVMLAPLLGLWFCCSLARLVFDMAHLVVMVIMVEWLLVSTSQSDRAEVS